MSSEEEAIETVAAARATAGVIHEQARLSRLLREHGVRSVHPCVAN